MRCPRRDPYMDAVSAYPLEDDWRSDGTCSYCGSISPERMFECVQAGREIGPTDKHYKIYVGGNLKFYFQHLDTEELRQRFIDLYNDRTMKIGYPGYFYVPPYFMKFRSREKN